MYIHLSYTVSILSDVIKYLYFHNVVKCMVFVLKHCARHNCANGKQNHLVYFSGCVLLDLYTELSKQIYFIRTSINQLVTQRYKACLIYLCKL